MPQNPNILICPLDWGLGHATRCVPVIRHLQQLKCKVFIAGSGRSLVFLKSEFPNCVFIDLPSYRFFYGKLLPMTLAMLLSSPLIMWGIFREHQRLKRIIKTHDIHGVISDNRFGLWNKNIPCVYLTHQVKIKAGQKLKFLEPLLFRFHRRFIKKYHRLWIPDFESTPNLSGELAHEFDGIKTHIYIGPLSRFAYDQTGKHNGIVDDKIDILAIISGPEPQRSIFESRIISQVSKTGKKTILLQGIPGNKNEAQTIDNLSIYPHQETSRMVELIQTAELIICRPGYSSIMDLAVLGKKAFFVPTPGQTEQEYLAKYLYEQGICDYAPQDSFDIGEAIVKDACASGFANFGSTNLYEQSVEQFVGYICSR